MYKVKGIHFKNVENILSNLGYIELEFNYLCNETNTIWYEGYLDTDYRIQVKIMDEETIEIWDSDYYVDNFVRVCIVKRTIYGRWNID